jgi:hypothetical protein
MTAGRKVVGLSQHWGTPQKYIDVVRDFFGDIIDLDPCSNVYSLVNARVEYSLPEHDGLNETWNFPTIYVNPPYGSDPVRGTRISHWLAKCEKANRMHGSEVLALIPVATNTGHWKKYVYGRAACICFLYDTRLRFLVNGRDEGKGAPMSCAMVYWGNRSARFIQMMSRFGAPVNIESLQAENAGLGDMRLNGNGQPDHQMLLL